MYLDLPHKEKEIVIYKARQAEGNAQIGILKELKSPSKELPEEKTNFLGGKTNIYSICLFLSPFIIFLLPMIKWLLLNTKRYYKAQCLWGAAGTVGAAIGGPPGAYIGAVIGSTLAVYLTDSWLKYED